MTDIVVVPTITPLPPYPTPEMDDAAYNNAAFLTTKAYVVMVDEMQAMGDATHTNATAAKEQADRAVGAATDAAQVQDIVLGAANFKGNYADLAGALPMPASVKHAGRFWLLTRNLANVAADVPGVSTAWTSLDSGQVVTQKITANTVGIAGVKYLIVGPNVTLTAPVGANKGDRFGFMLCVDRTGNQRVDFGAVLVRGKPAAMLTLDTNGAAADVQFEDNDLGWI